MNKVLIVSVPLQDVVKPPAILSVLAGLCEAAGADYDIFDLNLYIFKNNPEEQIEEVANDFANNKFRSHLSERIYNEACEVLLRKIKEYQPTHLAISVATYYSILATKIVAEKLRAASISSKIVIGGPGVESRISHITGDINFGQYCLDNDLVDYCVFGEGDIAFVELLKGNDEYPGINRIDYKQITDLDVLPEPSHKKIDPRSYFYPDQPSVVITGSRGCVRKCTFCDVVRFWKKFVYKSGERIAQEMLKIWQETGICRFEFSDSLINGSMKSFRKLNKELIRLRGEHLGFNPTYQGHFICRPNNQILENDYADMKAAGCTHLVVGIESFSEKIRHHMLKHFSNDDIDYHFRMCAKYGIQNALLLLSGYVTETQQDHQDTLDALKKYQVYALSRVIYSINMNVRGLIILEETPLDHRMEELGIKNLDPNNYDSWTTDQNPTLTPKERLRRGTEIICSAHDLGYNVLHFYQKLDAAEDLYNRLTARDMEKYSQISNSQLESAVLVS